MRKILLILLALAAIAALYFFWVSRFDTNVKTNDYYKAQQYLNSGHYDEAFEIIKEHRNEFRSNFGGKHDWVSLAVRTVEMMPEQTESLVGLYEKYPQAFQNHEYASLIVAGEYINEKKFNDFQKLRDSWKDRSKRPEDWFVLDSDALLMQGKSEQAKELLKSRDFDGPKDTKRLIRLAMIHSKDNLEESWSYLKQAEVKDPTNPIIQTLKGKVLEDMNQAESAIKAYQRAIELDPTNVALIDQLGDFYQRQNNLDLAVDTWQTGLDLPRSDDLWLKVLFWNKTYVPEFLHNAPPENPLIDYLRNLTQDEYWNRLEFDKLPKANTYLKTEQLTFWLQLIAKLGHMGDPDGAQLLLQYNPFKGVSWSPQIEQALRNVLAYRKNGTFDPDPVLMALTSKTKHPLFDQLNSAVSQSKHLLTAEKMAPDLRALIFSDEIFSAIFLAGGWNESAIYLHRVPVYPDEFPDWVAVEYTKALLKNRGKQTALHFALSQKQTEPLKALIKKMSVSPVESKQTND